MFKYKTLKDKCRVTIGGDMTVYSAEELKQKLVQVLAEPKALDINLSGVEEIDSAGIQLLMMAKKSRAAAGLPLRLVDHSKAVMAAFEIMGLVSYFGDPVVMLNE